MTTTIALHPGPNAGFDAPFEMLEACHERVERMLALLERLALHLVDVGKDSSAQQAAVDVMRYFDIAGPAHHEDEERHVFPALQVGGQAELARQLHGEHLAMAQQWAGVRTDLQAVALGGPSTPPTDAARSRWAEFAALYRRHLHTEETQAYPAVRATLSLAALQAMGREMATRRGLR